MSKVKLHLDWCSHKAAKYAVEHWHYSKSLPGADSIKIGIWENELFIGCLMFSRGANNHIHKPYSLKDTEVCELTRVALNKHKTTVTKIIAIGLKMLKRRSPKLLLCVSYADANQGHLGKIYQAGNWVYEGEFAAEMGIILNGKLTHRRSINSKYNTSSIQWLKDNVDPKAKVIKGLAKHKYLYPLDKSIKNQIEKLRKPYPKEIIADKALK